MARPNQSIYTLAAASLLGGVVALTLQQSMTSLPRLPENVTLAQDRTSINHAVGLSEGFKQVASQVTPSVVSITTFTRGRAGRRAPRGLPPELAPFFGGGEGSAPYEQVGTGSGVLVSAEGHILTNNHVVGDATEVQVRLFDGRQMEAKVVGSDPKTDVAVIKVEGQNLQPARLGDSDVTAVGEWVLAIGSPFRLNHTVTAGIVSAKGRGDVNVTDYEDFIQTDAAINPGNSGGPLVNMRGEVIAINTAIKTETGNYAGIGFAIPSNLARMVMAQLVANGEVRRGRLGAHIQDLTPELADSYRYGSTEGALISDVIDGGPAAKAQMKPEDIVVKLNGRPIRSASQLRNTIAATPPSTRVVLEVHRDGRLLSIPVVLDELSESDAGQLGLEEVPVEALGLRVTRLTPDLARRLEIRDRVGVVVTSLITDGAVRSIGLRPGDLIVNVDGKDIQTPKDLMVAMNNANLERGVRLQIKRDGVPQILLLRIGR